MNNNYRSLGETIANQADEIRRLHEALVRRNQELGNVRAQLAREEQRVADAGRHIDRLKREIARLQSLTSMASFCSSHAPIRDSARGFES